MKSFSFSFVVHFRFRLFGRESMLITMCSEARKKIEMTRLEAISFQLRIVRKYNCTRGSFQCHRRRCFCVCEKINFQDLALPSYTRFQEQKRVSVDSLASLEQFTNELLDESLTKSKLRWVKFKCKKFLFCFNFIVCRWAKNARLNFFSIFNPPCSPYVECYCDIHHAQHSAYEGRVRSEWKHIQYFQNINLPFTIQLDSSFFLASFMTQAQTCRISRRCNRWTGGGTEDSG